MQENSYAAAQAITTAMLREWEQHWAYCTLEDFTVLQPVPSIAEICGDTCSLNGTVVCLQIIYCLFFFLFFRFSLPGSMVYSNM